MPIPAKHSPALAVHNLRNRIDATKAQSGYVTHVDVPIYDAETLLKERDGLVAALEAVIRDVPRQKDVPAPLSLLRAIVLLASARGQA